MKWNETLETEAIRLAREDRPAREIAVTLAKLAGKPVSKSLVASKLKAARERGDLATPSAAVPATAPAAPRTRQDAGDEQAHVPDDSRPSEAMPAGGAPAGGMAVEDFTAYLVEALRDAQQLADACKAAKDGPGQGRAMRLAAQIAAMLQKQHARTADDGEFVRVKANDVVAAAERARAKLFDLADRFREEAARGRP